MVELRKRPARAAPEEQSSRPAKKASTPATSSADAKKSAKKGGARASAAAAINSAVKGDDAADYGPTVPVPDEAAGAKQEPAKETSEKTAAPKGGNSGAASRAGQGDSIDLSSFGGEVETHDGKKVTLKQLVDESKSGVVLFTYPKASTPGCTTQACAFRDGHSTLTSTGFTIYGLSGDSPKSNTNFKTKQNLPYTLLCNPSYSLIGAIGLQQGSEKRTKRGVWAVDKQGKVLLSFAGGPIPTVDAVKKLVDEHK